MAGWILLIRAISQIAETKELMIQFYMSKNSLRTQTEGDVPKLTGYKTYKGEEREGRGGEGRGGGRGRGRGKGSWLQCCYYIIKIFQSFSKQESSLYFRNSRTLVKQCPK